MVGKDTGIALLLLVVVVGCCWNPDWIFLGKNLEFNKRKYTFAIEKKVVEILYNIMIGFENTNTLNDYTAL